MSDTTLADLTYNRTLFFYNDSCLDQLQDCEKIVCDATFPKSKIWKQIVLLHTIKNGKSSIPVMVWMSTKQYDEYEKIGECLKRIMVEKGLSIKTDIFVSEDS